MATHDNKGAAARMRELLAYHEHAADALRTSLELLNGHATITKQDKHQDLYDAVQLDAARRKYTRRTPDAARVKVLAKPPKKGTHAAKTTNPRLSAKVLAHFSTTEPRPAFKMGIPGAGGRIGSFVVNGFLKRTPSGYLRTDKPYPGNRAVPNA